MELIAKGQVANLSSGLTGIKCTMSWQSEVDMDLAALFIQNNRLKHLIYYQNMGDLNKAPYFQLDQDAGVGDTADNDDGNEENITATKLDSSEYDTVVLIGSDYPALSGNRKSKIPEDLGLVFTGRKADGSIERHDVTPKSWGDGNSAVIAGIHFNGINWELKLVGTPFTADLQTLTTTAHSIWNNLIKPNNNAVPFS